jgi:hypothetical protein
MVNSDKYFSRPILDFSLLYKNNFDSSEYDASFSLNLFLYFSVTIFLNCVFNHCLQIETGRYKNIPRQQRLCNICKVVED